jgi:hypothetical protein
VVDFSTRIIAQVFMLLTIATMRQIIRIHFEGNWICPENVFADVINYVIYMAIPFIDERSLFTLCAYFNLYIL